MGKNFEELFSELQTKIHDGDTFFDAMPEVEPIVKDMFNCERVTVYSKGRHQKEIVSKFKSGEDIKEIRVPLSNSSIAGYVALNKQEVLIQDVYEEQQLHEIHENLSFNKSFDEKSGFRTKSVIAVPVLFGDVLLGVFQLLNRRGIPDYFLPKHLEQAQEVARVLGQKFRYDLKGTKSPYDHLVQSKRIKAEELEKLQSRSESEGTPVEELLIASAGVSKTEIGASLEHYYQVPYRDFDPHHQIPTELLKGINMSYLRQQVWVPLEGEKSGEILILIDNPNDPQKIMEIQRTFPKAQYAFEVGFAEDILKYLGEGLGGSESSGDIQDLVGKLQEEALEVETEIVEDEVGEDEATVIQLVNRLITDAYKQRASDIHIEPGKGKTNAAVRIRVDGACRSLLTVPYTHVRAVVSRIKIMSGLDISERRKPQDGKCVVKFRGNPIELRVATLPTVHGEAVVMRILASSEPLPLEKLNFSDRNLEVLDQMVQSPHGILLVVGPTGSGKTTTLHAVLGHINTPEKKIWTAEDPVEITQPGLNQVQMQNEIGLNFASALRAFLRADPDVIMIGEMRDHETAHIGVEASLTGHLVLSTLHTNSAPETVTRLLDLGLDPVSFSDALQGVLAQRLVRTLCSECRESYEIPEEEFTLLQRYYGEEYFSELEVQKGAEVFRANGCEKCGNTGYYGRTGIHELLAASEEVKSLIYQKATASAIKEQAMKDGMRTLMQDGIRKLFLGQTDLAQIRKVAAS